MSWSRSGSAARRAWLLRGLTLGIRERDDVQGAVAVGVPWTRIALRYILPNALPPVLAPATLDTGIIILAAAGLSFIGLGAEPPSPEWGAMLADAQKYFSSVVAQRVPRAGDHDRGIVPQYRGGRAARRVGSAALAANRAARFLIR